MRTAIILLLTLAVIAAAGLSLNAYLDRTADDLAGQLEAIKEAVRANEWTKAESMFSKTEAHWDKVQRLWTVLINHQEIDELEMSFGRISEYIKSEATELALAELEVARLLIKHIPSKEKPSWSNIL